MKCVGIPLLLLMTFLLAACTSLSNPLQLQPTDTNVAQKATNAPQASSATVTATERSLTAESTLTPAKNKTVKAFPSATIIARLQPKDWQKWPVVPQLSETMRQVYQNGLSRGNNPAAFMKVGDCESTPTWFLGDFDDPQYQIATEYAQLQPLLDHFHGSFGRTSVAAKSSFSAASVLSPFWADPKQCDKDETPLDCELRIMNPSFALVTLGTNDAWDEVKFEKNLRQIIERLLAAGVVPVLATKADNLEGDHAINTVIARLAYEYDLPLWNFWSALQGLPDKGLQEDKAHLTWGPNRFDDAKVMKRAWPIRNLTALQVLQAVWDATRAAGSQ